MRSLIIYDSTGKIFFQGSGTIQEPVGIPYLWVDLPERSQVLSVDTTVTPNVPVYEEVPKTEVQILQERTTQLEMELSTAQSNNLMILEAMADVYEAVLPFLPM